MTRYKGGVVAKTRKKPITQRRPNDFELKWEDINVTATNNKSADGSSSHILRNVSGEAKSGQLVAIMGNSGAGKTTLLEALSRRLPPLFNMTGAIYVNAKKDNHFLVNRCAVIEQFQEFLYFMTVREYLTYQYILRFEGAAEMDSLEDIVDEIMLQTGLGACQNSIIGKFGENRSISGGERRKLAFASEIIGNARILFCDEPTTGLDSFAAHECVATLRRVVNSKNILALFTIHQPSSHIVNMFDKIIILSDSGRVAYEGDVQSALKFFDSRFQLRCPDTFNPCDFFLKIVRANQNDATLVNRMCDVFDYERVKMTYTKVEKTSDDGYFDQNSNTVLEKLKEIATKEFKTSTVNQIRALLWRESLYFRRSWDVFMYQLSPIILIGYLILVYGKQSLNRVGVMNLIGLLAIFSRMAGTHIMIGSALTTVNTAHFLKKDYKNGLYGIGAYLFSRLIFEVPLFCVFDTFLMAIVFYWNIGLQEDMAHFSIFLLFIVLSTIAGSSTGQLIGAMFPTFKAALVCCGFLDPILDVFVGYMIRISSIPAALRWIRYLVFCYYGYHSTAINQFQDIEKIDCELDSGHSSLCFSNGKNVLNVFGVNHENMYDYLIYLVILIVATKILTHILVLIKVNRK